jgi:hypothetical protein
MRQGRAQKRAAWEWAMDLGFTWFDFAALVVLGLSGVMAFARGLIREVFSIIAFIGGAIAAVFFAGMLRPIVESFHAALRPLASVAAGLLIFLVVFIVITVITSTVAKTAHQSTEIGSFDRAAGLAFGILRGVLRGVALRAADAPNDWSQDATTRPSACRSHARRGARRAHISYLRKCGASALEAVLPQGRDRARDIIDRQEGESAPIPPAEPATTRPGALRQPEDQMTAERPSLHFQTAPADPAINGNSTISRAKSAACSVFSDRKTLRS